MNDENKIYDKLDTLINEVFREEPGVPIPSVFTDQIVARVEKRLIWKEVFTEFAIKIGLVAGVLIILAICLIFPAPKEGNPVINFFLNHLEYVGAVVVIGLFIFFIDQVLLKYFSRKPV